MPDKKGRFTAQENAFVKEMVRTNDTVASARAAGYAQPSTKGAVLANRPEIVARVQAEVAFMLRTRGAEVGTGVLFEIAEDKRVPAASRVMAARELVKLSGVVEGEGEGEKPLSSLTRAELAQRADQARAILAELDAPVIEHEPAVPSGGVFD